MDQERSTAPIDQLLFYHDYAPLVCILLWLLGLALSVYTSIRGAFVMTLPTGAALVPSLILFVSMVWLIMGAVAGWVPPGMGRY